ncbi:uncharacterized protein LOC110431331 isoform X3 [Sorghum bicolor]|uniref:uncharacterized protein LOC110431331 isoform X3 n=1 Tax=Sorghum bicolor TaxID=4558 RepID=UPI000B426676|nr:uncharacterized protein LOC110431331 isoform X3 [Sorghum bicolor]|eukprot:XP_021306037.1 uncharacterized protein LOC110431331 isoform X3 [Sorghum bicolor]
MLLDSLKIPMLLHATRSLKHFYARFLAAMQTSVEASFSFLFEMNSRRELRTILNNEESRPSNTTELQQRGRLKAIKPRKRIIIVGGALQGARTRIENGDRHRKHERHQSSINKVVLAFRHILKFMRN